MKRFFDKVTYEPNTGCWLWSAFTDVGGYGVFRFNGKTVKAHRWSYEHHVGPIPSDHDAHHACHQPSCVNPNHIEPIDSRLHDSMSARDRKRNWSQKVSAEQAEAMRAAYATGGFTQRQLAKMFGLASNCAVNRIVRNQRLVDQAKAKTASVLVEVYAMRGET